MLTRRGPRIGAGMRRRLSRADSVSEDCGLATCPNTNTPYGECSNRFFLVSLTCMHVLRDSSSITDRQREVIQAIAQGLSNEELGQELGISPRTAKAHCDVLRQKLGVPRRRQIPLAYRLLTGEDPLAKSLESARVDNGG
jgi:DNA-binding CsgD family transcriptional regulator